MGGKREYCLWMSVRVTLAGYRIVPSSYAIPVDIRIVFLVLIADGDGDTDATFHCTDSSLYRSVDKQPLVLIIIFNNAFTCFS